MANAPYKHSDGSDCYTKNCSLGNVRSLEAANKAVYDEFAPKIEALHKEMEQKLQQNQEIFQVPNVSAPAPNFPATAVTPGSNVVDSADVRVQNGEVLDKVRVGDIVFTRYDGSNQAGDHDHIRIQANKPLNNVEMQRLAGLVGYNYRSTVSGESLGEPERDSPYSFVVYADSTKSARSGYNIGDAYADFHDNMADTVQKGSPVRKTNRSGPGTAGTRLINGLGDDFKVEVYYDDIINL